MKTKINYLESLESLKPFLKKVKIRELKYKAIMQIELKHPIWLKYQRSSYYNYKNKPLSKYTSIDKLIIDIYNKSNRRFGYRSIKLKLKTQYNIIVNHKKIQRIMNESNIQSIIRKKFKKIKYVTNIKPNILNRDFYASRLGEKFVTDITYIPTQRKMT